MIPLAVQDLRERVALGLERGAGLLTAEEVARARAFEQVDDVDALLLTRLYTRKPCAFRLPDLEAEGVDDLQARACRLRAEGWLCDNVSGATKRELATRKVLAAACKRRGLAVSGTRQALQARLEDLDEWDDAPWIRVADAALWLRLERFATLRVRPDASAAVVERLGHVRWVSYPLTHGDALMPSRDAWLAWEAMVDRLDPLDVPAAMAALDWPVWPPGRLNFRRELVHALVDAGHALERQGAYAEAVALYDAVEASGSGSRTLWLRGVRARELAGDLDGAWVYLAACREQASGAARAAMAPVGRRLSKRCGRAWVPDVPLAEPRLRTLRLDRAHSEGMRPLYVGADEAHLVEEAVAVRLRAAGCTVWHAEGALWSTLVSLLLVDVLFMPLPGMLPVPRLSGPIDAGTPQFAARRAAAVWDVMDAIAEGRADARLRSAWQRHEGARIHGVDWRLADLEGLLCIVEALGPQRLAVIVGSFLREGRRAQAGMPDLCAWVPSAVAIDGLHPGKLEAGLHLIEVKGEHDTVRDGQRVWFDRLVRADISVELWRIVAR